MEKNARVSGCPVYLPKVELYDKMLSLTQREKHVICECLFHTVNWFIEVRHSFRVLYVKVSTRFGHKGQRYFAAAVTVHRGW